MMYMLKNRIKVKVWCDLLALYIPFYTLHITLSNDHRAHKTQLPFLYGVNFTFSAPLCIFMTSFVYQLMFTVVVLYC